MFKRLRKLLGLCNHEWIKEAYKMQKLKDGQPYYEHVEEVICTCKYCGIMKKHII